MATLHTCINNQLHKRSSHTPSNNAIQYILIIPLGGSKGQGCIKKNHLLFKDPDPTHLPLIFF